MIEKTIYYYISKLNEEKAMKILYSNNKENIIFRDYIDELIKVDLKDKIRLLKIIDTKQSKLTALWLEEMLEYPEHLIQPLDIPDDNGEVHPAAKKILSNSIAYLDKMSIKLIYKNTIVAEFNPEILSNVSYYVPSMMKFDKAIDWIMENTNKIINIKEDNLLPEKKLYEKTKYINISLAELNGSIIDYKGYSTDPDKIRLTIFDVVESYNYNKLAETITQLPANTSIRVIFLDDKELKILNKIAEIIELSKIKNSYLRLLFKMIKTSNKPLIALTTLHYLFDNFEAISYRDLKELKDYEEVSRVAKRIEERRIRKELKRIKNNGLNLESHGIKINYDGTVDIYNIKKFKWSIKFPALYY